MTKLKRRHLVSLADLSDDELYELVFRGLSYANGEIEAALPLQGLIVGIYFRKTSTRTRTSFSAAALRLGAQIISYGPNDLQENTGEIIQDTAKILSIMLDGLVSRTAGSQLEMETFASQNKMSVINAMTQDEHPTQALADLTTMLQHFGELSNLRVLYLGEGNNTAAALALSLPRFSGTQLFLYTPPGYGLSDETMLRAQAYASVHGSTVIQYHDVKNLPKEVDIVYTTRWETTGTIKKDLNWIDSFKPFKVSQELMDKYAKAVFMHDLPAHRNEEVDASVLDGPKSIAFKQAENKLHSACAVLEWCLTPSKFQIPQLVLK
jgi:ornithine carbamoyltransferase